MRRPSLLRAASALLVMCTCTASCIADPFGSWTGDDGDVECERDSDCDDSESCDDGECVRDDDDGGGAEGEGEGEGDGDGEPAFVDTRAGVPTVEERDTLCAALIPCAGISGAECDQLLYESAALLFPVAGCAATERLIDFMSCAHGADVCASTACDAAFNAWLDALDAPLCTLDTASIGIGDPVSAGGDSLCDAGVHAAGGWCSRACSDDFDCVGHGTGGTNSFGTLNTCAEDTFIGGFGCYPTCSSTVECQAWFGAQQFDALIACKTFDDGSVPANVPVCVRVTDDRGAVLP